MTNWKSAKKIRRIYRKKRKVKSARLLPVLRQMCDAAQISMLEVEHGYQFRRNEYVINWSPTTNKVQIQYALAGHGQTIPFIRKGSYNKPRIIVAIEELIELVRSERDLRHST